MQNPANEAKRQARIQGLSYWEYMAKKYNMVHRYVWGTRKLTRKQKLETSDLVNSYMARSPRFSFLSQIRNLIGKRSAY